MDELEGLRTRLDALVREQSDRATLREQHTDEVKAQGLAFMTKQAKAAERYVMYRRELGKREDEKGRVQPEEVREFDFEPEAHQAENGSQGLDFESSPPSGRRPEPAPPVSPVRAERPARRARMSSDEMDDEDDAFMNNRWRG
ncbi:hypothetical protein [Amycolatopsis panacis]|uniref:Uncharacterized protein n=1 Tax=Amycolatopsis panacis TaxID=2340917 RepID=A0A419I941_9PSEU|nr:hypothetical protein [Amycolatopsis panacis]RJQ89072.1 hypothetical protein D5S19_05190 [Amycolatopsis panacis]